ncbi:DUF7149 domain-containing protein [Mucilaginibacter lappiensis]|uniref:type IIG restriction enzyme/methyltransferase n=1 Tax=Mucilaginibacter lappiensis TaxID=354630 RepID=UPI003D1A59CF
MNLKINTPKQSLNKAYLKEKISRSDIELFKAHFIDLMGKINDKGDEEHLKSLIADFLKLTWYNNSQHQINPIGKNDLVIHTGKSPNDPYGVILEVKSPSNTGEMITAGKTNVKAVHELILYYLDERITRNRNELKQLIITNIYDWYIIDANEFDKKIYRNTAIKKLYELKKSDNKDNPWFYDELKKLLASHTELSVDVTHFDIRDYKKVITNADKQDDKSLIALYKILSPVHLLKLPFANDSNTLQPKFYSELLHIIGLHEYKEGSKKLINRKNPGERNTGSLLENAIIQLDSHDKVSRVDKPSQYGDNQQDRLYNIALELVITWVNRILFLKLLEAQLINYHKGDRSYTFLTKEKIKDFDDLDKLFFRVLAKIPGERTEDIQKLFAKVPYLNSSLFEPTELEHQTLFINGLEDFVPLPVISSTVLKDAKGKALKGNLDTLDYLFAFLNAYDFSSEGAEEIQEDNKQLINASVLGLIFEKINGYKDGSFFTPGFITMYMCRETIRRAVVQKFNETKGWELKEYDELYNNIQDKKEANAIINSLKICDPAVGSGHFLVSALNEMIAIKSDLQVLMDKDGRTLRSYGLIVENDELIITDENGDIFEYNPNSKESQRIQETLFHEKQTIIENCLFGVDINPNSVKICRLRLWIELLKNAYYKADTKELETLPNIDINIKTGNSLISRFALDADLKQALRNTKWNINDYKIAVGTYKNATDKASKHELVRLIDSIKNSFRTSISRNAKEYKELSKLRGQLDKLLSTNEDLFGTKKNKKQLELEQRRLEIAIGNQESAIEEIKNNKIYENAFEWRFEFPEVLNDEGDFLGFDVVIGNPPYVNSKGEKFEKIFKEYSLSNYKTSYYQIDTYILFIEKAILLMKTEGYVTYITPNAWLNNLFLSEVRKYFIENMSLLEICNMPSSIFEEAVVDTIIIKGSKTKKNIDTQIKAYANESFIYRNKYKQKDFLLNDNYSINIFQDENNYRLLRKIEERSRKLKSFSSIARGVGVYHKRVGHTKDLIKQNPYQSKEKKDETFVPYLRGKNIKSFLVKWDNDSFISYGTWLAEPREPKYFDGNRILLRQIPSEKLIATFINSHFIVDQSVFIARFDGSDAYTKAVLGIINSQLMIYYFRNKYSEFDELFPKVKLQHFKDLPIMTELNNNAEEIAQIVNEIISLKNANTDFNSRNLEIQIDQLVYQLYDLTEEEIKIVEGGAK